MNPQCRRFTGQQQEVTGLPLGHQAEQRLQSGAGRADNVPSHQFKFVGQRVEIINGISHECVKEW
ncbi:MAG: hypothetical protein AMXMBFR57_26150 [Acidimicrobiia bacterium]